MYPTFSSLCFLKNPFPCFNCQTYKVGKACIQDQQIWSWIERIHWSPYLNPSSSFIRWLQEAHLLKESVALEGPGLELPPQVQPKFKPTTKLTWVNTWVMDFLLFVLVNWLRVMGYGFQYIVQRRKKEKKNKQQEQNLKFKQITFESGLHYTMFWYLQLKIPNFPLIPTQWMAILDPN